MKSLFTYFKQLLKGKPTKWITSTTGFRGDKPKSKDKCKLTNPKTNFLSKSLPKSKLRCPHYHPPIICERIQAIGTARVTKKYNSKALDSRRPAKTKLRPNNVSI